MDGQVLITTHSPQIVERFGSGSILRLTGPDNSGVNHARGCNADVDEALAKMGYRLNAISTEVFFSDGVLLVEGPSERMLYTILSCALGKEIDRLNISVLSVDGIGFEPYVRACKELGIPYAVRTDNDIFGLGTDKDRRIAGVKRLAELATNFIDDDELKKLIANEEPYLTWKESDEIPDEAKSAVLKLKPAFEEYGLFLSQQPDLEHDLAHGPLLDQLKQFFGVDSAEKVVNAMQQRKAENMHSFIASNPDFCSLEDDPITAPLNYIVKQVESSRN